MRRVTRACDLEHLLEGWRNLAFRALCRDAASAVSNTHRVLPIIARPASIERLRGTQEMVHVTHVADVRHRILCCELLSFGRIESAPGP